jgi:hypothetical protein
LACLPGGVFCAVACPATGAPDCGVALRISPLVYGYVAYAAEYWSALILRHCNLQSTCDAAEGQTYRQRYICGKPAMGRAAETVGDQNGRHSSRPGAKACYKTGSVI